MNRKKPTVIPEEQYIDSYRKHKGNSFATLLGFYKGHYHNFVLSMLFFVIKQSPVWVLPIVTSNLINYITEGNENFLHLLLLNLAVYIPLTVMNIPTNYMFIRFRSLAVRDVEAGLRSTLIHKIQKLTIPYQKDIESGRLQSKVIRDVESVETLSDQLFTNVIMIAVNVVVALGITVFKSRIVFFFFVLIAPVGAAIVFAFRRPIKKHNQNFRREVEETSAKVAEMVELVPVTRAHALEKVETRRMDENVRKIAHEGYVLDIIQGNFGAVSWVCFQLFQVAALVFTAVLAFHRTIEVGDIVMYQSYFTSIVGNITAFLNLMPIIAKGLESVASIGEILMVDEVEDDDGKEVMKDCRGSYEFENVSYHYPHAEKEVIRNLTLSVKPHETVAFVGESGAGKSTIMNLLVGFCIPTSGRLLIDGKNIKDINLHSYRKFLAVVPQDSILFSGTIRENILYGTEGVSDWQLQNAIEEAGLKPVIESLPDGLDTLVGERGGKLSGGQRQRIAIARALIRSPRVLILDEATSALDANTEQVVSGALDKMSASCTTFIVAHRLETVKNADQIVVMKDGCVEEVGTYDSLLKEGGYFWKLAMHA